MMRIVELTPKEIITVVKDVVEKGKFSDKPITYELQKEALRRLIEAFENKTAWNGLMDELERLDKYYTEKYSE